MNGLAKQIKLIALQLTSMASAVKISCSSCGNEVGTSYMYTHYKRFHSENQKTFSCTECSKTFFDKQRYENHMKSTHPKNTTSFEGECPRALRENMCDQCDKTFVTDERLREHKAYMHRVDPITFQCLNCKKYFDNARLFKAHSNKNHLDLPCNFGTCEKKFGSKNALRAHKKAKHPSIHERIE